MNRPSKTDEPQASDGYNQSPSQFSNDLTTNRDLIGISNTRTLRGEQCRFMEDSGQTDLDPPPGIANGKVNGVVQTVDAGVSRKPTMGVGINASELGGQSGYPIPDSNGRDINGGGPYPPDSSRLSRIKHAIFTFGKFVGPGFMVAVAYIDPGNYATDVAAGASYRFRLLFIVLLSNIFAIFLQSLSIKLGTVSGLNLAEACRAFLPRWLNYALYAMAEAAIIATDISEVIGTAIALNLLIPQIPLVAGCALSILEVMIILLFYRANGSMQGLRAFEYFVMFLVLAVVICFCIQLSLIRNTTAGEVFRGYLPSSALVERTALYQACGILGATVMPHSLYLGSGIVQSRLYDYDRSAGLLPPATSTSQGTLDPPVLSPTTTIGGPNTNCSNDTEDGRKEYIPSLAAIRHSLKYSIVELALSLFAFALFVNSAILIVAGASLYNNSLVNNNNIDADLFGIHALLTASLSPVAGTVFALALLFSGVSAGIVCTITGQMVSEGALRWRLRPWLRRLVTRSVSIAPSAVIAAAVGRDGLSAALNGSQVALSVVLPFVSAPLIWFTSRERYMRVARSGGARFGGHFGRRKSRGASREEGNGGVEVEGGRGCWARRVRGWAGLLLGRRERGEGDEDGETVRMANGWLVTCFGVVVWLVIAIMNVANLALLGMEE